MSWENEYNRKLMSFEEAAKLINSGDIVWTGALNSCPNELIDAISDRYEELKNVIMIGDIPLRPYKCTNNSKYIGHIDYHTLFMGDHDRRNYKHGNVNPNIVKFSNSLITLEDTYKVNTMICEVSEPDEEGYMYFGTSGVAWNGKVAKFAKKIIVQVNKFQKKTHGWMHKIHVNDVDAICRFDHELEEYIQSDGNEDDEKIASYILPMIEDGSTLQIGIGAVANAVAFGLAKKKNLGVQTEMLTDSLVHLIKIGSIDKDRVTASFILGNKESYDFATTGIPKLGPVDEVIAPQVAGNIEKFIAINSCIMSDLTGQICSESIGHKIYSGTGGQLDCVQSAMLSKGGKSFMCLKSRVKKKDGTYISTINLNLPQGQVVTVPRTEVMYVVTEYGIADLFNKPIRDRVKSMIAIAHPDFRQQLYQDAEEAGLI